MPPVRARLSKKERASACGVLEHTEVAHPTNRKEEVADRVNGEDANIP